ncbi:MAG TPA: dolichyl-phosphate beta-glucosyltransferase [Longimicrobium sp.]|nr:dolichyl-phosphate beta-glucosyltransferase [Longimicrobium sp.]
MSTRPDLSIVFPARDEEARLEPTLRQAAGFVRDRGIRAEMIVVDDGSRDGTGALVLRLADEIPGLRLIRLAANRGKGHAVRTGVVNARGFRVLFADADGATPMPELPRLGAALDAGADVAIGSRARASSETTVRARLHRRLIGRAFHLLVETLTVRGFSDTQCGFKLFTSRAAHDLFSRMRMDGFSFDVELLLMARRRGYRVAEVPVNWTHVPGSRVNLLTDSARMARDLFVIRGRALRGLYDVPHLAPMHDAEAALPLSAAAAR